ncbi:hypothetical protein C8R48DRAFT_758516 [Suillus tomentosus]|nr:hypothetical protein C8R48DRAFT_758516 [Suillus tomentosus]
MASPTCITPTLLSYSSCYRKTFKQFDSPPSDSLCWLPVVMFVARKALRWRYLQHFLDIRERFDALSVDAVWTVGCPSMGVPSVNLPYMGSSTLSLDVLHKVVLLSILVLILKPVIHWCFTFGNAFGFCSQLALKSSAVISQAKTRSPRNKRGLQYMVVKPHDDQFPMMDL